MSEKLSYKQVHLDFHTSPDIDGVGKKFSKKDFQDALVESRTDSITIFAKCHHSLCYYPTQVGTMHPNLDFDLTGTMVDAAHEIGVKAPIYITAGWSDMDSFVHPEWRAVDEDGHYFGEDGFVANATVDTPKKDCVWYALCLNDGEYAQHIYALTEEVCKRYPVVDGLFYDICAIGEACYCETCKKGMRELGLSPDNKEEAKKYFSIKRQLFMSKCSAILKKFHPDATIFFNGTAHLGKPAYYDFQSHFEMENLPTAWGGYDNLPIRAKFFKNTGKSVIGMTGKFHLDWGEFGGYKFKEALKYEVATMATYGIGASIGDHMHPDGQMEMQTYKNIGYAFDYLDQIAPYCFGGKSTAEIGLYVSAIQETHEGISNILLENQIDYDLITDNNFKNYKLVIVPDKVSLEDEALEALRKYQNNGGKILLMADALVKNGDFQLNFGAKYIGVPEYDCDYISLLEKNDKLPDAPLLCNIPGHRVEVQDAEVYAEFITPYFNRTFGHFCGHKNTPYNKKSKRYPAILKKDNIVYLSHSLPKQYYNYGSLFHKRYFMYALNLIYTQGFVVENLGAQGRCRMICQPHKNRYCVNMVYAVPTKRGKAEIIEDILPVYNIKVSMKTEKQIQKVYLPLENITLDFCVSDGILEFVIPKLQCHSVAVIDYL